MKIFNNLSIGNQQMLTRYSSATAKKLLKLVANNIGNLKKSTRSLSEKSVQVSKTILPFLLLHSVKSTPVLSCHIHTTNAVNNMKTKNLFSQRIVMLLCLMMVSMWGWGQTTYTWTGATNTSWANTANWSRAGGTGTTFPGTQATDIVLIPTVTNQPTLSTTLATNIASLTFTSTTAATLTITGQTLNVTGAITLNNSAAVNTAATIAGTGTLYCASATIGGQNAPTTNSILTTTLTSTIASLSISGNLTINGRKGASSRQNNGQFNLASGSTIVGGTASLVGNFNGAGAAILNMASGAQIGTLFLSGATPFSTAGTTTITLNGTGATVNYTGGAQTVLGVPYVNLGLSGSGAKTLQAGTTAITGNLSLGGTVTTATVVGLTVGGALTVGNGTTFNAAGFALTVTGATTVGGGTSGTLTVSSATGAKLFTGLVTIAAGATWSNNTANSPVTFLGGITNNGTFTAGSGVQSFTTTASQALNGTFSIPSVTVTSPTVLTNNNSLNVATALAGTGTLTNSATGTLNLNGTCSASTLTNNGNITSTGSGAITSTTITNNLNWNMDGTHAVTAFTNTANGVLSISATPSVPTFTTLTTNAAGNTVNYDGLGTQTVKANSYSNLGLSGSGTKTLGATTNASVNLSIATGVRADLTTVTT